MGIHIFRIHRSARGECVDARINSGHDGLIGIMLYTSKFAR
jgi:hypothetical protein